MEREQFNYNFIEHAVRQGNVHYKYIFSLSYINITLSDVKIVNEVSVFDLTV